MHRVGITILIVALLACPYACQAGSGCCASTDGASPAACCDKCDPTSVTGEGTDPSPADDECTSCCLCKGAVLGDVAPDMRPTADYLLFLPLIGTLDVRCGSTATLFSDADSVCFGESLRIAIGSFLC